MTLTATAASQAFLAMTKNQKRRFLVAYAHELTIVARMCFADGEVDGARLCNESVHRVLGYLCTSARRDNSSEERTFIAMIAETALARGWAVELQRALASPG